MSILFSRFPLRARTLGLLGLTILVGAGCSSISYMKEKVKNPFINETLTRGFSVGAVDGGEFTKEGWQPGESGTLTYNLPGMPQGIIEFVVKGLDRSGQAGTFLTLVEPGGGKYADPYILYNPFRVTVALNSHQSRPETPFDFLWTIKRFPPGTKPLQRYVKGIPQGVDGYEKVEKSGYVPIYPDQTYTLQAAENH